MRALMAFLSFPSLFFPALFTSLFFFPLRCRETDVRILPRRMPTDVEKTRPGNLFLVFDRASTCSLSLLFLLRSFSRSSSRRVRTDLRYSTVSPLYPSNLDERERASGTATKGRRDRSVNKAPGKHLGEQRGQSAE